MLCRSRNRQSELRLVLIRRLRSSATTSIKVISGCSAIRAKTSAANSSSGEMLPPRGSGAALLFLRQRCSHFTAELTLTSKRSAVSRREAPLSSAAANLISDIMFQARRLRGKTMVATANP